MIEVTRATDVISWLNRGWTVELMIWPGGEVCALGGPVLNRVEIFLIEGAVMELAEWVRAKQVKVRLDRKGKV